ncbi:MAG: FkbM family methyltransferase [Spirochaetia bacterium]|nr:FkbM family methyltransferase [Spirochaetia bacterium]
MNSVFKNELFSGSRLFRDFQKRPWGFIDIGARGGFSEIPQPVAGITAVMGFEPDAGESARMQKELEENSPWAQIAIHAAGLSDKEGPAKLHCFNQSTNDSLLPPNPLYTERYKMEKWKLERIVEIQATTLDQVLAKSYSSETFWGEFLKIDTQGTEYQILRGAEKTLRERTVAIATEVEFFELYKGQKLFSDLEIYLRGLGFSFYGFMDLHSRSLKQLDKRKENGNERAFFANAVFLKDPFSLADGRKDGNERGSQVLFLSALMLGYFDFALEIVSKTWVENDPPEARRLSALVHELARSEPKESAAEVEALAQKIRKNPDEAPVLMGKLVDRHRFDGDYFSIPDPS